MSLVTKFQAPYNTQFRVKPADISVMITVNPPLLMRHKWLRPSFSRDKLIPWRLLTGEEVFQRNMCICKCYVRIINQGH